ncbi:hypothetical protein GCM10009809_40050 [Isoptericola hypogeus]|uniref:Uncharacterized protein n=1 Tax=Isoptericola hypogeus TaxID=300179 RepID=A0ABN2JVQ0_9MICO
MEIGESLVGAYLRHVRGCHTVAYNAYLPEQQGEIDVIGIAGAGEEQSVWIAEVAIHLDDLNYGGNAKSVETVRRKVDRALQYARNVYNEDSPTVEFWSPKVPPGIVSGLEAFEDITLVLNHEFTRRVNELAAIAGKSTKQYGDDGFRFLQVLTHLVGNKPQFAPPSHVPSP